MGDRVCRVEYRDNTLPNGVWAFYGYTYNEKQEDVISRKFDDPGSFYERPGFEFRLVKVEGEELEKLLEKRAKRKSGTLSDALEVRREFY